MFWLRLIMLLVYCMCVCVGVCFFCVRVLYVFDCVHAFVLEFVCSCFVYI